MKKILIILTTFFILSDKVFAQIDTTFSYKGKLISPEALMPFFPNLETGKSADTIDLSTFILKYPLRIDSPITNFPPEFGYTDAEKEMLRHRKLSISCDFDYGESASYSVIGKLNDRKFVIKAFFSGGGTFRYPGEASAFFSKLHSFMVISSIVTLPHSSNLPSGSL